MIQRWFVALDAMVIFIVNAQVLVRRQLLKQKNTIANCTSRDHNETIEWKKKEADCDKIQEKTKYYYNVEAIIGHEIIKTSKETIRHFTVKWEGYDEATQEPEKHLDGCFDLLQKYLIKNGLPLSKIPAIVGASSEKGINENNWVSLTQIIETYQKIKAKYFPGLEIEFEQWQPLTIWKQGIYLVPYQSHCYVILFLEKENYGLIADGTNNYISNAQLKLNLRALLKISLREVTFNQQNNIDYCGSSAVLISFEFARMVKTNIFRNNIITSTELTTKIQKLLHPFKSEQIEKPLHERRQLLVCENCKRKFLNTKRRNYFQHIKFWKL